MPKNTALIITREKGGYLNIMRSPISASAPDPIQQEVSTCLEAISRSMSTKSSAWVVKKPSRSSEALTEDSLGRSLSGGEAVAVKARHEFMEFPKVRPFAFVLLLLMD